MNPIQESSGAAESTSGAAAPVDLDLAFSAAEGFPPELLQACGSWCDPLTGEQAWLTLLAHWLAQLAAELPTELRSEAYSLGLSLVNDAEIAALNAEWRDKSGPTDVLAFAAQDEGLDAAPPMPAPQGEGWPQEPIELGDIVISVDTASRQADEHGYSLTEELLFLASHGLLHLLGWDHPDEPSLSAMLQRQRDLMALVPPGWDHKGLF